MPEAPLNNASRPRQKSPNRILAEAEEQWLFTEAELARTPSIQDGMTVEQERETRAKGLNFIRQVGIMLKLPELTLSTAAIFFNRYLMRMSLKDRPGQKALHHYALAGTCLFLATKVEESCRKLRDFIEACCRVAQKKPEKKFDEQSKDYWKWRDTILQQEDVLLETLCFDLTIDAPHKQLFHMLKTLDVAHNKPLRNAAWAFVTDSNMTPLCLVSRSRAVAAAALYAGARLCDVRLKDFHGKPWWQELGVTLREMITAANFMCHNYENPPQKGDALGGESGGASIYVGFSFDLDSLPDEDSMMVDGQSSLSPPVQSSERDELPWEKTRLKAAQGIASPAALGGPDSNGSVRRDRSTGSARGSVTSQGSVKRAHDSQTNGSHAGDSKRQKLAASSDSRLQVDPVSSRACGSQASALTPMDVDADRAASNSGANDENMDAGEGSEEGEI